MNNDTESRELWRSEIGEAAGPLWDAFRIVEPPAPERLRNERQQKRWLLMGVAASWVAIAVLFAWNLNLQGELTAAREQTALALLAADRSDQVLAGLAGARRLELAPGITAALLELLKYSADPNVQLEALDLLLNDVLTDVDLRREVLDEIRFNRSFIELAIQTREIQT